MLYSSTNWICTTGFGGGVGEGEGGRGEGEGEGGGAGEGSHRIRLLSAGNSFMLEICRALSACAGWSSTPGFGGDAAQRSLPGCHVGRVASPNYSFPVGSLSYLRPGYLAHYPPTDHWGRWLSICVERLPLRKLVADRNLFCAVRRSWVGTSCCIWAAWWLSAVFLWHCQSLESVAGSQVRLPLEVPRSWRYFVRRTCVAQPVLAPSSCRISDDPSHRRRLHPRLSGAAATPVRKAWGALVAAVWQPPRDYFALVKVLGNQREPQVDKTSYALLAYTLTRNGLGRMATETLWKLE